VKLSDRIGGSGLRIGVLGALLEKNVLTKAALEPGLLRAKERIRGDRSFFNSKGKLSAAKGNDWRMLAIAVEELGHTEINPEALGSVETLSFDGGAEIYLWIETRLAKMLGLWEQALDTGGESDVYAVEALDGLAALPHLSVLCLDGYGGSEAPRSLSPLAGHPTLRSIALLGDFTFHEALLTCPALRFLAVPDPTPLPEPVRSALAARDVVLASAWRWDGDDLAPVHLEPAPAPVAPPPLPRHLVAFRLEELPAALCRGVPEGADLRRCLFWVGPPDESITAPLFLAIPEPPTELLDAGLGLLRQVATLLSRDPAFVRDVLGGTRHTSGFHTGPAADVEAFLRSDGVELLPIAPYLATVQLIEIETAVGLAVAEATFRRVTVGEELGTWPLEALSPGLFAVARAWSDGAIASVVTPSGVSRIPESTAPYVLIRESLSLES
jgi:hypothetical protein